MVVDGGGSPDREERDARPEREARADRDAPAPRRDAPREDSPREAPRDDAWRALAEAIGDGLLVIDRDLRVRAINRAGLALVARTEAAVVGHPVAALFDDGDALAARLAELTPGAPVTLAHAIADGAARRVVELVASATVDGDRIATLRDVTARVAAEERLARSEAGFRALIERTPDAVAVHKKGAIVYLNPAATAMLGWGDGAELLGRPVTDLVHPDDRATVRERVRRLAAGERAVPFTEEHLLRKDGGVVIASVAAVVVEFGGEPCVAVLARDVTEQRRVQARLAEADRLVALGNLAEGLAHEINNPLTYLMLQQESVAAGLDKLRPRVPPEERAAVDRLAAAVATAAEGARRVRDIVRDLRVFARPGDEPRQPVDVRAAIGRALALAGHQLRRRATLAIDLPDLPWVRAAEGPLTQVLLNLLIHAAQAVGEDDPAAHRIGVRAWSDGARVHLAVSDSGPPLAPEHLPHLFEPFFSTGRAGDSAGLGLSVARGIVTSLGGTIEVDSAAGRGTTFTIALPIVA